MEPRKGEIPPSKLISALRRYDLLPAIVFLSTRRQSDEAALEVGRDRGQKADPERFKQRKEIFDAFVAINPEVDDHKHSKIIVNNGIAAHHAGHIPSWKLLIER